MTTLTIRQASLADLDELASLFDGYRQFYGRASDLAAARAFLLARFDHGESVVFIAHQGGKPVGFTQLYPSFSSVSLARVFVLNDLYVDAAARQGGVGRQLLEAAVAHGRAVGAVRLMLSTATTNLTAQSVYEGAGWKRDEQFFVYQFALTS